MRPHISLIMVLAIAAGTAKSQCSLTGCGTITFTNVASCQFTMNWNSVTNADHFTLQWKVSTAGAYNTISNIGLVTSYTLTGLSANTTYKVKVAAVCSNGATGPYASSSKKTVTCSTPSNLEVTNIGSTSAIASWLPVCGTTLYKLKYKKHSTSSWTTLSNISTTSYTLTGLVQQTKYDVEVLSDCGGSTSKVSPVISFSTFGTLTGKNVLLIVLDDARQDCFTPDGGPSWFIDPNISRIADEGARFKYCFPSESVCASSRSSIITGLYPHKTGVLNNIVIPPIVQKTLAEILHDNNYYTGFVGKYHLASSPQTGYDYWMENTSFDYYNATWNVNGIQQTIAGHKTDVATDSTIAFFHKVPVGKSFFIELAYAAPHTPYKPRYQDTSLYKNETMPLATNPAPFSQNYPDFLYPCQTASNVEPTAYLGTFQLLAGVEDNIGRILNELTSIGLIDSTLIIFTDDNGYMLGEHDLDGKRVNYEESLHLPLYMRYPPKIASGTVISNDIAMNIDLAPTVLDYVNIANTWSMDGISLKKVIAGTLHRSEMFNEYFAEGCMPDIRSVRSLDHIYTEYGCDTVTQEFFDLVNDPKENNNLINNAAYDSLITVYQSKLAYWENYYAYTTSSGLINCQLANPVYQKAAEQDEENAPVLKVFPNPSTDVVNVVAANLPQVNNGLLILRNSLGERVMSERAAGENGSFSLTIPVKNFAAGMYFLTLEETSGVFNTQFLVQKK